jgi:endonuclease YncB( thermonuclease family)
MRWHHLLLPSCIAVDVCLAFVVLSWREQMLTPSPGAIRHRHAPVLPDPDPAETTASIPPEQAERPEPPLQQAERAEPPRPEHQRFFRVIVADGGRLQVGDATVRLYGISAPERGRSCRYPSGESWPCGARAAAALSSLIRSRAVECDVVSQPGGEPVGRCRIGNVDLSHWMLRYGWAEAGAGAESSYADALRRAQDQNIGLWAGRPAW